MKQVKKEEKRYAAAKPNKGNSDNLMPSKPAVSSANREKYPVCGQLQLHPISQKQITLLGNIGRKRKIIAARITFRRVGIRKVFQFIMAF